MRFYDYALGKLEYRTVRFETEVLDTDNYQGRGCSKLRPIGRHRIRA